MVAPTVRPIGAPLPGAQVVDSPRLESRALRPVSRNGSPVERRPAICREAGELQADCRAGPLFEAPFQAIRLDPYGFADTLCRLPLTRRKGERCGTQCGLPRSRARSRQHRRPPRRKSGSSRKALQMFSKEKTHPSSAHVIHASDSANSRRPRRDVASAYLWYVATALSRTASINRFSGWMVGSATTRSRYCDNTSGSGCNCRRAVGCSPMRFLPAPHRGRSAMGHVSVIGAVKEPGARFMPQRDLRALGMAVDREPAASRVTPEHLPSARAG